MINRTEVLGYFCFFFCVFFAADPFSAVGSTSRLAFESSHE